MSLTMELIMFEPLHWYVRYVEGVNVTSFHQLTPFGMSILVSVSEEWAGRELDLTVEQWRLWSLDAAPRETGGFLADLH